MTAVFIVPTGVGAAIGGHAGDATPALKVIAQAAGRCITHPNVVNASAINEMPESCLYVEGSMLDSFLERRIGLMPTLSNRVLVIHNNTGDKYVENLCGAAESTIGMSISRVELRIPLLMRGWIDKSRGAGGSINGIDALVEQVRDLDFDAVAVVTSIDTAPGVAMDYFKDGGVNPWGGVEAIVSRQLSVLLGVPVAHAPVESHESRADQGLMRIGLDEVVDRRIAAEVVCENYAHCVLKGLYRAPRQCAVGDGVRLDDLTCLVTPTGVVGRPHLACRELGVPVIAVRENATIFDESANWITYVATYLEAAGMVSAIRAGVDPDVVGVRRVKKTLAAR